MPWSGRSRTCRRSSRPPVGRRSRTASHPARCCSCMRRSRGTQSRGWRCSSRRSRSKTSPMSPISVRRSPSLWPQVDVETRSRLQQEHRCADEIVAGMREAPFWPTLERAAHTLVYDTTNVPRWQLDPDVGDQHSCPSSSLARGATRNCRPGGAGSATRFRRPRSPNARGRVARGRAGGPRSRAVGVSSPSTLV